MEASLEYLCIYNPDLNPDGEHVEDEVVFYYPQGEEDSSIDDQLRHIGLTQGVVEFSRGFSEGATVSNLETYKSRIVVKEVECDNWWVVASINFASTKTDGDLVEYSSRDLPGPDILCMEIVNAYRRWRLHHGSFGDYLNLHGRGELVKLLQSWWNSWCRNWCVSWHGPGSALLFDGIRTAKGDISSQTLEAAKSVIDREDCLLDMIISRHDQKTVENNGCVFAGKNVLSSESIVDVLNWVQDCESCEDDTAYLDETGFVYHLQRPYQQYLTRRSASKQRQNTMGEMASQISTATVDSINNLMGMINMNSVSGLWGSSPSNSTAGTATRSSSSNSASVASTQPDDSATISEDIAEARYMVGLYGNVLETDDSTMENGNSESSPRITKNVVYLSLSGSQNIEPFNVVIYRRRPFVFTLIYEHGFKQLDNASNYITLHRRLASLVEPVATDLDECSSNQTEVPKKFYYIVMDPNKFSMQTSLPHIFKLPQLSELEKEDPADAENIILDRLELIHVHQSIAHISAESGGAKEHEKFMRTSKNWWIYWARLNDDEREVILAHKWSKPGKPSPESLLSVLGRDAKVWLDTYKHYGKV
ncbi:hypothetical protein TRICI_000707 [Trichomonascus ciferrii]|uniref:CCZ1/INTU/HSP4 first Longin domain-containing protein n=1 Tax=Trichomonascus ciferrii TaxID=44093 RepID=A0A642VAJ6_9ASCO|nr:hypothetical protein TRICI_000707 [Trichomonascus ciferrii]